MKIKTIFLVLSIFITISIVLAESEQINQCSLVYCIGVTPEYCASLGQSYLPSDPSSGRCCSSCRTNPTIRCPIASPTFCAQRGLSYSPSNPQYGKFCGTCEYIQYRSFNNFNFGGRTGNPNAASFISFAPGAATPRSASNSPPSSPPVITSCQTLSPYTCYNMGLLFVPSNPWMGTCASCVPYFWFN